MTSKIDEQNPQGQIEEAQFFESVVENGSAIAQDEAKQLAAERAVFSSLVEPVLQQGVLDSGCEIVSLSMVLKSMGIDADPVEIADNYIDYEGGMTDGFVGSPYYGGGAFPPGIAKAANAYLIDKGSDLRAYDLTGNSFESLVGIAQRGYPVLVWTTIDFADPLLHDVYEGDYQWYGNEHCVVLCGMGDGVVVVCDPLEGVVERDAERFAEIYELCGSMALYIH